jgi:iron transport multicopper oxidase
VSSAHSTSFNSSQFFIDATASITYSSSSNLIDLSPVPSDFYQDTDDTSLVPIIPQAQLPPATRTIELDAQFYTMDDGTNRGTFNNITFNDPKVPSAFTQVQYADEYISE